MADRVVKKLKEETVPEQAATRRWFVALDWLQRNNRSFDTMVKNSLCAGCAGKFEESKREITSEKLLSNVQKCCSKTPDFITGNLPVSESIFRLFLANGNRPLELTEMGQRLRESGGGDAYRTSPEILLRLLENDRYYGFQELGDNPA